MDLAVNSTATNDDDTTSNILKRRRSSSVILNENDIEQTLFKRVRSLSPTHNSTSDNNNIQTVYSSLNDIVQSHRNLVREYVNLQMCSHPNLSFDEQRFVQAEEDLIEKVEKNLHDINNIPSTPPLRNGKRQRYQSINSTNQSYDRLKHETHILKRIEELKSDGKWTNQRLAKCLEPPKRKTHWDYLLDEMRWLAEDFLSEKRWKQAMAKKLSQAVLKYFHEKNQLEHQREQQNLRNLRKRAQFVSKEIRNFWSNIHKISEYKRAIRLEEFYNQNSQIEDQDDEQTIEIEEQYPSDEYDLHELEVLKDDQLESVDHILKHQYGIDLSNQTEINEDNQRINSLSIKAQAFQTNSVQIPVPSLLKYSLREYQHVGLDWLVTFYENNLNGILADDDGLGKTIQTIALIAHLACEKGNWGPHLIIVQENLLLNWEIEFKRWCPALKILTYSHKTTEQQDWTQMNEFHICLTSYDILLQDIDLFHQFNWQYLILDNIPIESYQIFIDFPSQHRLILMNRSLPNSKTKLLTLIEFLIPNLSNQWFSKSLIEQEQTRSNELIVKNLQKILQSFTLRRLKSDVENQLPQIYEHMLMCNLVNKQKDLYETILQSKSSDETSESMIEKISQLTKICNHPNLFEIKSIKSPFVCESQFIQYKIPHLFEEIHLKNPYLEFDYSTKDTFLCFRLEFSLQATKEMFKKIIYHPNNDYDSNQEKIQLTNDIIQRYRNSSLWSQFNQNLENDSERMEMDQDKLESISQQDDDERFSHYEYLCKINSERCQSRPLYGCDMLEQVQLVMNPCQYLNRTTFSGYSLCQHSNKTQDYSRTTDTLQRLIHLIDEYPSTFNQFRLCTTRVLSFPIELYQSTKLVREKPLIEILSSTDFDILSQINPPIYLDFPSQKYLQFNCGKLQTLDKLLLDLKHQKHRCLIYTHMIKMLDILELYLNSQSYTYLRLDQNINSIEQQQRLIERFNNDKKIFVFILSTRLITIDRYITGADTVILYDFDLNPLMNNQVDEQCDRMRQIKDVHIYRLINENTIEESLLKQIKDNNLTLNNIQQLIYPYQSLDSNRLITDDNHLTVEKLVETLESVENEDEIEDFNENQIDDEEEELDQQLRPIERYALRCIETYHPDHPINSTTYLDIEQIQKDWQSLTNQEQADKPNEQDNNDDLLYTYPRDNERKIWVTEDGRTFEIWSGIIVKASLDENDEYYNDDELDFGYESEPMIIEPEEYIRFPLPKALVDTTNMSKSDTNILVPRSLFDRSNLLLNTQSTSLSTNTLNKSKQIANNNNNNNNKIFPTTLQTSPGNPKARQLYVNNGTTTTPLPTPSNTNVIVSASTTARPIKLEEMLSKDNYQGLLEIDNNDWLISEDYKVLDAIQNVQQLPLSSMSFSSTSNANKPQSILSNSSLSTSPLLPSTTTPSSPTSSIVNNTTNALTQNWDFISDIVNRYSRVLRTPKQCKHRFEQVIGPREEGRVVYDLIKKKKHVIKGTVKMSDDNWQMLRTNQLFAHDNCQKLIQIYQQKFETVSQFEQQFPSIVYLNKFKQMQIAQATHHQMRGLKLGSLLQDNNINLDVPLTPSDVTYQRAEREKELKRLQQEQQQQQQQQSQTTTQPLTPNVHSQVAAPLPNNTETVKQPSTSANVSLAPPIPARTRPSTLTTAPSSASINPSPSTPISLMPAGGSPSTPTISKPLPNNIIVANSNHPNMNSTRSPNTNLPTRSNLPSSTAATINSIPTSTSNQSSIPTATIVPGQRPVQVLPPNHISTNEINSIQQKQLGTVQITSNDYHQVRTVPQQAPQRTTSTTNPSPTPTNVQVRTANYQKTQAQGGALPTLEVRSQLPPSPKPHPRPSSTTPRPQTPVDFLLPTQTKSLTSTTTPSSLPVAVVRPMQHTTTNVPPPITSSSSPASPGNVPSINITLPSIKSTTTTTAGNTVTANNPPQQIRTATAVLSNPIQSTSQSQQIRQLYTNTNNNTQTTNPQRLNDPTQRSPSNISQIIGPRTAPPLGQVRNVRILTFTPGTNPPTGLTDSTSGNPPTTNITYNRANSSTAATTSFPRSTINLEQEFSPDIAAQVHRIKSFNVTNTDPNDPTQTPRAVLVPARTISGSSTSSTSSVGSTSKLKSSSLIDPATLNFATGKPNQTNIVFQLPPSTTTNSGGDDQINSSGLTRQNLLQHLNLISSNNNQRSQSPTTTLSNPININRFLQQYQLRPAAINSSTSTPSISSSGQTTNEQIASSSPPPPHPPSSSTT